MQGYPRWVMVEVMVLTKCSRLEEEMANHPSILASRTPIMKDGEADVDQFREDLQDLLELTPKKCLFHHRGMECKSRKSRDTWSNQASLALE